MMNRKYLLRIVIIITLICILGLEGVMYYEELNKLPFWFQIGSKSTNQQNNQSTTTSSSNSSVMLFDPLPDNTNLIVTALIENLGLPFNEITDDPAVQSEFHAHAIAKVKILAVQSTSPQAQTLQGKEIYMVNLYPSVTPNGEVRIINLAAQYLDSDPRSFFAIAYGLIPSPPRIWESSYSSSSIGLSTQSDATISLKKAVFNEASATLALYFNIHTNQAGYCGYYLSRDLALLTDEYGDVNLPIPFAKGDPQNCIGPNSTLMDQEIDFGAVPSPLGQVVDRDSNILSPGNITVLFNENNDSPATYFDLIPMQDGTIQAELAATKD